MSQGAHTFIYRDHWIQIRWGGLPGFRYSVRLPSGLMRHPKDDFPTFECAERAARTFVDTFIATQDQLKDAVFSLR
jgi:hypothetical protein